MASSSKVVLLACGSFNPPTNMHLRMFEVARDFLHRVGNCKVIGGILTPVNDAYQKKNLEGSLHRCQMVRLAVEDSDWLHLSDWESVQTGWVRTRTVLEYHQNAINRYLGKASGEGEEEDPELLSASADALTTSKKMQTEVEDWLQGQADASDDVRVRLLCGADLLESFAVPGLWEDEDVRKKKFL
ncbi:unnamed protein product [Cyprideis torosa]|uniref:Cytidyltransferase-like domain-containing protein n=1 Tax=Cyprideis torosa TaxID=163714 RepID=A0A7R8WRH0_9CRUS|nr:unnamed protein product [Cyprideis torosa]CAG0907488.1 unnamed protein product [Cyprideis torosa]